MALKIGLEELLDERVGMAPDLIGRADGQDPALVDDGDAVGHAKGQFTIVRHDERRDADASPARCGGAAEGHAG